MQSAGPALAQQGFLDRIFPARDRDGGYGLRQRLQVEVSIGRRHGSSSMALYGVGKSVLDARARCGRFEPMPQCIVRGLSRVVEPLLPNPVGQMVRNSFCELARGPDANRHVKSLI